MTSALYRLILIAIAAALVSAGCQETGTSSRPVGVAIAGEPATTGTLGASGAPLSYAPAGTEIALRLRSGGRSVTRSYTALPPRGMEGRITDETGKVATLVPGCWGCSSARTFDRQQYFRLWPLQVGKKTTFAMRQPDGQLARQTIEVVRVERIRIADKQYDAYVLKARMAVLGRGQSFRAERTDWWAPEVGWIVRSTASDSLGRGISVELVGVGKAG